MTKKIRPTIICPECGEEWREKAPGSVQCPNSECHITFKVDDYGMPRVMTTIICPKCGEEWRDEALGSVVCPHPECREAFEVDKYGSPIQYTASIKCFNCGESWEDDAPGTIECPTCGKSFDVNSKGLPAVLTTIICPECGEEWQDEASRSFVCINPECRLFFKIDRKENLISQEINEKTIRENNIEEALSETFEDQLPGYDKTQYVQVTAKDSINGQIYTVFLKHISENKNGIVGTEVDKNGDVVKENLFDEKKHIILKGALLSRYEARINQNNGLLEVPSQVRSEIIVQEKALTQAQSKEEIAKSLLFSILENPKNVHEIDCSNLFAKLNKLNLSVRTFNCLINTTKLTYIGELVQKTESELMKIPNFGRKCLREVKKILSDHGLRLGMIIPDFDILLCKYDQQSSDAVEDKFKRTRRWIDYKTATIANGKHYIKKSDDGFEIERIKYDNGLIIWHEGKQLTKVPSLKQADEWIDEWKEKTRSTNQDTVLDKKSHLDLFRKVSELSFSPRALNCMVSAKIVYVGDLVSKTEHELLKIKNMGRLSISEIKSNLKLMGLDLGIKIHEWSQVTVEEEIKLLTGELEMHRKNNAKLFLPDIKHADFLEEELIHFVEMFSKMRNIPIIVSFFGFDGKGKKTLETTGEAFDITRERVRQITKKYLNEINQSRIEKDIYLPICKNIENYIISKLPIDADLIEMELVEKGFTKKIFKLEGIIEVLNSFDKETPFNILRIGRKCLLVSSKELNITRRSTKLILQISNKLVSRYGITNVTEINERVFQKTGQNLTDKFVVFILSVFKNFSWLDESKGWFWLTSTSRNRILNIIRKILSVCESITLHELRAGIGKSHRMEGLVPTTRVLLEMCKQIPWCKVEDNIITANPPIKAEKVLGNHELRMYQILKEQGPLMATFDFETTCSDFGIARNSFYQYLSYSPILNRYVSGVYGLRGAHIPPGLAESIAPIKKKSFSKIDYGWTKEGNIWIIRQLAPSIIHDGRFSIPTALSQYLPESFMLKSEDGTIWGNLQIDKNYHSVNIHAFLKRSGYEAGDYLAMIFYLSKKEATAYMGGEEIWDDFV